MSVTLGYFVFFGTDDVFATPQISYVGALTQCMTGTVCCVGATMPETELSPSQSWSLGGPLGVMLGSLAAF